MVVVTEAWLRHEFDLTMFLQISFSFSGLGLGYGNISSKHAQIKTLVYNGKDRELYHKL